MTEKAEPIATNPLATARQLWRLNKDGALRLAAAKMEPISAATADQVIRLMAEDALELGLGLGGTSAVRDDS